MIERAFLRYRSIFKCPAREIDVDYYVLADVVQRYWRDVDRLHHFHGIKYIDSHKISGYLTYWLSKLKPFRTKGNFYKSHNNAGKLVNELIGLIASVARINTSRTLAGFDEKIVPSGQFIDAFMYSLRYRYMNPDSLSIIYYFVDVHN